MNEQELRALVRDALTRHAGASFAGADAYGQPDPGKSVHPSHGMFPVPAGADSDGSCLIEPAVLCHHCGYCRSYGH